MILQYVTIHVFICSLKDVYPYYFPRILKWTKTTRQFVNRMKQKIRQMAKEYKIFEL